MILEDARQLSTLAREAAQARVAAQELHAHKSRYDELRSLWQTLDPSRTAARVLREAEILQDNAADLSGARYAVEQFAAKLANPGTAFEGNDFGLLLQSLKRANENLKTSLERTWRVHCKDALPVTNQELLSVLANVPAFQQAVKVLRAHQEAVASYASRLPTALADVQAVEREAAGAREVWDGIANKDVPQAVVAFLREATGGGAPLHLLTEEVRTWLNRQRLDNQFRVRVGATSNPVTQGRR